jgi:prepilin-type N-terminal cleavage/methylation domain-containing protein
MMHRWRTDQRGFTLIEVLVAALILVIAFTALAVVFTNGQNEASADVEESQLINLADQQIEQLRGLVESSPNGFDSLALSGPPISQSTVTVQNDQNTFQDPTQFVITGTPDCYEIDSNYDNLASTSSRPYGAPPAGFTAWSDCAADGEPLEVIPSSALITEQGTRNQSCALGPGNEPSTLNSPCVASLTVGNGGQKALFDVYTFVTDTYVGCGSGATTSTTAVVTTSTTSAAYSCAPVSGGSVTASQCATASAVSSGTFGTTSTASSPCADARRVIVAVVPEPTTVHSALERLTPVYVSSIFTNPIPTGSDESGTVGISLGAGL